MFAAVFTPLVVYGLEWSLSLLFGRFVTGGLDDVTQGAGIGAWCATVALISWGFGTGAKRPWDLIISATVLCALGALGLFVLPTPDPVFAMVHTVHVTWLIPFAALWLGAIMRRSVKPGWVTAAWVGATCWTIAVLLAHRTASIIFFDPGATAVSTFLASLLAAMLLGFGQAVFLRRFAFPEVLVTTLIMAFGVFAFVVMEPSRLTSASNSPIEQVLVASAVFPVLGLGAFAVVGASLGFLFYGSGRFEPGLRYEWGVALRYLKAHRRDGFVGTVTVVAVLGVCLGVMALIVVLSIMSGFEADLKSKILGAHAHVVVNKHGDDFEEYTEVEDRVRSITGVDSSAAFVLADAMISTDIGLSGTLVKGVDPRRSDAVAELQENLQSGSIEHLLHPDQIPGACPIHSTRTSTAIGPLARARANLREPDAPKCDRILPGIIIGRELSRAVRAYVGDVVKLVSPLSDTIGPMGPIPKLRKFRVAGIFFSGMYEYDAKGSYLSMEEAQRFFGLGDRVTGVEIKLERIDDTSRVVTTVVDSLGGEPYSVRDWRDMNKELFSALLLEKIAMFVALAMIVMVASFLIIATLVMIVLQRGKEIAILKSLGASDASVMKVFVLQGLVVGVGGAVLGVLGGIGACWALQSFGVPLDERVFYIEQLPVVMDRTEILVIAVAAMTISYLATIYPAFTAARLRPVEGLRDD